MLCMQHGTMRGSKADDQENLLKMCFTAKYIEVSLVQCTLEDCCEVYTVKSKQRSKQ